ncbi:MAG: acetylglutamate kinase [Candidatus Omnitrophica bacterium]|nr:acetylglutamate kinase [Candidatus Omnitrophota bacterium]MBI3020891.1 acetylglutamate kinase [Candidatus Omnitrophota bacterium]
MEESIRKAEILIEALPYIQAFRGKVIVVKYGGSAIDDPSAMQGILQDLVFLSVVGIRPVLVHGGGPMITRKLSEAGKRSAFIEGMRVTDRETIRVVNRELEAVNRRLVALVTSLNGHAEGVIPRHRVILASPHPRSAELGFVGSVQTVRAALLRRIFMRHAIPVISPVGIGDGNQLYNINADDVASEVAVRLKAEKLVLLTNVRGIQRQANDIGSLISTLPVKDAKQLIERRVIQEGMIPKVRACVEALRRGVRKTHIIDASIPHAMLLEIFTKQGIGTEIVRSR